MGTISKALTLLDYFSVARPEIGLSDFMRITGRDKATVYRHLCELEENGFVEQDPASRDYRIGPAVLRLANVRERCFPLREALRPTVDAMSAALGELVHVSLLQGRALSPLYHRDSAIHGTRVFFDDGEMLPLHATASGQAVLAYGAPDLLDAILAAGLRAYAVNTPLTVAALRKAIDMTRRNGYSTSDQAFEADVFSHAVPLFGPAGVAIGALAVALPRARATPGTREAIIAALKRNAPTLSQSLGGTIPPDLARLWNDAG